MCSGEGDTKENERDGIDGGKTNIHGVDEI
jgi:hypothetical protein